MLVAHACMGIWSSSGLEKKGEGEPHLHLITRASGILLCALRFPLISVGLRFLVAGNCKRRAMNTNHQFRMCRLSVSRVDCYASLTQGL